MRYAIARATKPMSTMPIKLKKNERGMNHDIFIFRKPKKPIPSSSGKGEAMIKPPTKNDNHRKSFSLNNAVILFPVFRWRSNSNTCSENLSRTNLKIIKSPTTAPSAPSKATNTIELAWAISPRVTMAGAVVKTEVKNKPATKLPRSWNSCVDVNIFANISVFTKIAVMPKLMTIINTSCSKKPLVRPWEFMFAVYQQTLHPRINASLRPFGQKLDRARHLRIFLGSSIRLRKRYDDIWRNTVTHDPMSGRRNPARHGYFKRALTE